MKLILALSTLLFLSGCSIDQMLVRASTPMIEGGVDALNHETDLDLAEDSIPANLNMLLGMINIDPDNAQLQTYAAQAFYGLAYGFNEDNRPERASAFYLRGLAHGLKALEINGANNLQNSPIADFEEQVARLGKDDVAAMFWTASCWAKWIDMHRDDAEALAELVRATALMQRVADHPRDEKSQERPDEYGRKRWSRIARQPVQGIEETPLGSPAYSLVAIIRLISLID